MKKVLFLTGLVIFQEVFTFHAGTAKNQEGEFVTAGRQSASCGGKGRSLVEAQEKVYQELRKLTV